jgi:osmotically-inducible protein OsmY
MPVAGRVVNRRSDERLREDLRDRLTAHPAIDAREVKVEVSDGRVVLRGSVPDRRSKYHAEDLAEDLPGVVEVDNRLHVTPAGMRPPEANGTQMS